MKRTDYHCHILPGIDDGAKDITESVFFTQRLVEWVSYDDSVREYKFDVHRTKYDFNQEDYE